MMMVLVIVMTLGLLARRTSRPVLIEESKSRYYNLAWASSVLSTVWNSLSVLCCCCFWGRSWVPNRAAAVADESSMYDLF